MFQHVKILAKRTWGTCTVQSKKYHQNSVAHEQRRHLSAKGKEENTPRWWRNSLNVFCLLEHYLSVHSGATFLTLLSWSVAINSSEMSEIPSSTTKCFNSRGLVIQCCPKNLKFYVLSVLDPNKFYCILCRWQTDMTGALTSWSGVLMVSNMERALWKCWQPAR